MYYASECWKEGCASGVKSTRKGYAKQWGESPPVVREARPKFWELLEKERRVSGQGLQMPDGGKGERVHHIERRGNNYLFGRLL